jgi:hypothetical protein
MDDLVLPNDQLELGDEIARGANGAVRKGKLFGMVVCAKVRRGAAVRFLLPFFLVCPALEVLHVRVTVNPSLALHLVLRSFLCG